MRLRIWMFSVIAFALPACGSTDEGGTAKPVAEQAPAAPPAEASGQIEGSLEGESLPLLDARVFSGALSEREPVRRGMRIRLSSHDGLCASPDKTHPGGRTITFDISAASEGDDVIGVGTYTVDKPTSMGPSSVMVRADLRSDTCANKSFIALSGTVTVDEADARHVRGTFEVKLGHDTIRGSFDAPACDTGGAPPVTMRCE